MNKIIFFVVCFLCFTFSSKAVTLTTDYQTDFYSNRFIDNVNYSGLLAYPRIDGKIVYCLNPKVIIGKEYIHNDLILNEYTEEQLEYLKLIAKYGYNEKNNTIEYYAATQQLIWEYLDNSQSHFYWTTEKNSNGKIILINDELKHIRDRIDNFYEGISFQKNGLYGYVNETIYFQDFNNQLSNYEVESAGLNEAWIDGNNLYIKINVKGTQKIKLKYKSNGSITKTYSSTGYQNLISFGDDIERNINIYVYGAEGTDLETPSDKEDQDLPVEEEPLVEENKPIELPPIEENPPIEDNSSTEEELDPEEEHVVENIPSIEEEFSGSENDLPPNENEISIDKTEKDNKDVNDKKEKVKNVITEKKPVNEIKIYSKELPNTYNNELKYYVFINLIFLFGIGAYYKST